ncbi:sugar diacid recognition domain-containing protein [Mammaliicoccus sciuri]|uniref:Transcriptional regulator, CdaR family n=1 Tax=Sporosarcina newyorkensis TaxID=759851 RepID=A0A1T4XZ78_9BACL|nr:sugar diacid recognition domain-containing protein [Sporosarcina newyorkensis]SKA94839.1 transcriptional regulator, CdaR family [Sporosarcina newyorkensis]
MSIHDIANKIIQVMESLIDEQIIICDTNGIIIASTDLTRLGNYHEGAAQVIKSKEPIIISKQLVPQLEGVKTGVNLPIFFNKSILGVVGITGETEKVRPFGEIVRKMTELLINENYYSEQIEFEHRSVENFLFDVLNSRQIDHFAKDRAETIGIRLDGKKQVILLSLNQVDSAIQKEVWQYIKGLIPEKDLLIRWGNNRLFWMHTLTTADQINESYVKALQTECENNFSIEIIVGVGDSVNITDLNLSYEQARMATKYNKIHEVISYYRDLQLELCLQEISDVTKKEFITRTIGNLVEQRQLVHTLTVFLEEELSIQKTAERLFIHVNTLHYRLTKIYQLTGLDPKRFKDLTSLYLALTFLEEHTITDGN